MRPDAPLTSLKGIGPRRAETLGKLGLFSVGDLLRFAPRDYRDYRHVLLAGEAPHGQDGAFALTLCSQPRLARIPGRGRLNILTISGQDASGKLTLTWFNQPYRQTQLKEGQQVIACGRVDRSRGARLVNPTLYPALPGILPIYPMTRGLSQSLLRDAVRAGLEAASQDMPELLPPSLLARYDLMPLPQALASLHFPKDLASLGHARRRLAFEDLLLFRLMLASMGNKRKAAAPPLHGDEALATFLTLLPFTPTQAQYRAMGEISKDLCAGKAMNRLIQGDVGSGKTAVAFYAMYAVIEGGGQAALMAPTEILARQHYEKLVALFGPERVRLLLGGMKASARTQAWEELSSGQAGIAVGTHALLRQEGIFSNLQLIVTDEQHRFGVSQRAAIQNKGDTGVHVLVMSATPIPRTLALLLYGDLEVSRIDQLPPGRKPVQTKLVPPSKAKDMYAFIQAQAQQGRQAYIVCPLVEENEDLPGVPGAVQLYRRLQKAFPDVAFGLLHGQQSPKEKEAAAAAFRAGQIQVLVSTTVIEVGVDVPNATVMAIEHADRFGLAQLHQLRGRVGRGEYAAYCFLLCSPDPGDTAIARLHMLTSTQDGFAIAEADLAQRGPGDFLGTRLHGLSAFTAASLAGDVGILQEVQEAAQALLDAPTPESQPLLQLAQARLAALAEEVVGN